MNNSFLIVFLVCCTQCIAKQTDNSLSDFREKFDSVALPFNSSFLNENRHLIRISTRNQLSPDEVLKYILGGRRDGLEYEFEKYDMESGESKGFEKRRYQFYPVCRIEKNGQLIFVVLRTSINTQSYLMSVSDSRNKEINEVLEINTLDAEDEYRTFQSSYLDENLQLKVFKYQINPDYLKNIKTESKKSVVTETIYVIERGIKLISNESRKSNCSVADFYQKNKNCQAEDPMRTLPTNIP